MLQIVQSMEEMSKRHRSLEGKHREGKLDDNRHQFDLEEQRQQCSLIYRGQNLRSSL